MNSGLEYESNNDGLPPLHITITRWQISSAKTMLENDATLAYIQDSDGLFPVHAAASTGNAELVWHFIKNYPDSTKYMDPRGRNIFHIAAEVNRVEVFYHFLELQKNNADHAREMVEAMMDWMDYEGNKPFHVAAMNGSREVMRFIWEMDRNEEEIENMEGLTPFDLSSIQVKDKFKERDIQRRIRRYVASKGRHFTQEWFEDVMEERPKNLEKIEVFGVGSALIITAAFSVAFQLPGGLDGDHGTPILGRRYIFKTFILATASAFILALASLFSLSWAVIQGPTYSDVRLVGWTFSLAAASMVLAFAFGMFLVLAPVIKPIAILLILTLPFGLFINAIMVRPRYLTRRNVQGIPTVAT